MMFRAEGFERQSSSGGIFNAVYAEFKRSVSQCFERRSSSGEGLKRNKTIPFILLKKSKRPEHQKMIPVTYYAGFNTCISDIFLASRL